MCWIGARKGRAGGNPGSVSKSSGDLPGGMESGVMPNRSLSAVLLGQSSSSKPRAPWKTGQLKGLPRPGDAAVPRGGKALSDEESVTDMMGRLAVAFTHCQGNAVNYERSFLAELGQRLALPLDVPVFWISEPADYWAGWVSRLLPGISGQTWMKNFGAWVEALPQTACGVPVETTRERMASEEETARLKRQEEQRQIECKMDELASSAAGYQSREEELHTEFVSLAKEHEQALAHEQERQQLAGQQMGELAAAVLASERQGAEALGLHGALAQERDRLHQQDVAERRRLDRDVQELNARIRAAEQSAADWRARAQHYR